MNDISSPGSPALGGDFKKKTPRAISLDILNLVEGADHHLDTLLGDSFKRYRYLTPLDRSFITELTYGTLRWRGKLDWAIGHFSRIPFKKIEPIILNTLRLGAYQILFLSRTPVSAAVNESVELAKRTRGRGGGSFVNALLRSIAREKDRLPHPEIHEDPALHLSVIQSHPLWLVRRWIREFGVEGAMGICLANNRISPLTLRTNTLKVDRLTLMERLRERGIAPSPTSFSEEGIRLENGPPLSELPFLQEGLYIIQDEASQLVSSLLDPKPGERVLDACAAPGAKTTHMAQRMEDRGEIYALDLRREKLNRIEEGCRRLGIGIVKTRVGDATHPLSSLHGLTFDLVLADVPCSGFGTLQKNPDLKWKKDEADINRLGELQLSILRNLSAYVKRGGILVYSTCTVFHEENEDVVGHFLKDHPEFHLDRIAETLPEKCHAFIRSGYFKTFPNSQGMDGFFAARLKKG